MSTVIYHNPRCSKSRQTLELLQQQSDTPEIVEYLKNPPSRDELQSILNMLGIKARDIIRTKEPEYKELGLSDPAMSEQDLIDALVKTPKLIERPIVVKNGRAAIGRPPESVLEIL